MGIIAQSLFIFTVNLFCLKVKNAECFFAFFRFLSLYGSEGGGVEQINIGLVA